MANFPLRFLAFLFASGLATVAAAADGQIVITHTKALNGTVIAGDPAGYPVRLPVAGSYILGSDLAPGPNLDAIVAASSDTAIDLNGFKISGGPAGGSNNARFGIWRQGDRLTVKNGTITGFKNSAIHNPNLSYLVVENMRLINSLRGIYNSGGSTTRIQNSTVASNVGSGIVCGRFCHVEGSVVIDNGGVGIFIFSGTILGNTIASNTALGIHLADTTSESFAGYGNNTIFLNNGAGLGQVTDSSALAPLHPNFCGGPCP